MAQKTPSGDTTSHREPGTIVVEDEVLRAGFTQVPNAILTMSGVSHGAKLCYALLLSYAWREGSCFPGQETLGHDLGVERKAVIRYLGELKDKGLIRVIRRGLGKTNVYYLPKLADVPKMGHQEVPHTPQPKVPSTGHKEYTEEEDALQQDIDPSNIRKTFSQKGKQGDIDLYDQSPESVQSAITWAPHQRGDAKQPSESHPGGLSSVGETLARRTRKQGTTGDLRRQRTYSEARQRILAYVQDFAVELGDEAPLTSSVTRAFNLYRHSGVPLDVFTSRMYEARSLTQEYSANITKHKQPNAGEKNIWGPGKNKMAYWFSVLEELL